MSNKQGVRNLDSLPGKKRIKRDPVPGVDFCTEDPNSHNVERWEAVRNDLVGFCRDCGTSFKK